MNGLASTLARRAAQAAVPRWVWPFARPAGWSLGSAFGSAFGSVFGSAFGPAFAAFGLALAPCSPRRPFGRAPGETRARAARRGARRSRARERRRAARSPSRCSPRRSPRTRCRPTTTCGATGAAPTGCCSHATARRFSARAWSSPSGAATGSRSPTYRPRFERRSSYRRTSASTRTAASTGAASRAPHGAICGTSARAARRR